MTIHWKAFEQYFTVILFFFYFTKFVILENLSILDSCGLLSKGTHNTDSEVK